jgi:hypothetical protein
MDIWWWVIRLAWLAIGFLGGVLTIGVLALASQTRTCEDCLLYQRFVKDRRDLVEARRKP